MRRYTVNEVEERTKVPGSTLRQWERRYGFPKPERSDAGYRLYCDADISHIEAMKRHISEGVPASRAAELVRQAKPLAALPGAVDALRAELVAALTALDDARADRVFSEAHGFHPLEAVLALAERALAEIGALWHSGRVAITTEHFASAYVQGRLRALLSLTPNPQGAAAVIVACAPLEQHELGALSLALLLRRAGYRVLYLGANTPLKELSELARQQRALGVMISATAAPALQSLLDGRRYLHQIAPVLAFGGAAFNQQPELARTLGGDFLAPSAALAVERFLELAQDQAAMRA